MTKRVAVLNDPTNMGGYVITASGTGFNGIDGVALLGDLASCAKCNSYGKIIEGAYSFIIDGKPVAYDGCIIACKCSPVGRHKIIAVKSHMYVNVSTENLSTKSISPQPKVLQPTQSVSPTSQTNSLQCSPLTTSQSSVSTDDRNLIKIDANRLLKCADELCEKHLYYDENKHNFKQEVKDFATDIITQVDNGSMTYQLGAKKIKEEENSLWEQSFQWTINGLAVLGGIGMMMTGFGLCSTGLGCLIGAPLMAHGANGIFEGATSIYNGAANAIDGENRRLSVDGFLREGYQKTAETLGFDSSVGTLVYDLIDFGVSVRGKIKLVPKINTLFKVNELNPYNTSKIFKLWRYGRQDLERAYLQMKKVLLNMELYGDTLSLINIYEDFKKAFVLDKNTQQVAMVVSEPEKINNIKNVVDNCTLVVTITGENDDTPGYFICEKNDGSRYKKDFFGNLNEGGTK